jgi:simple sugar transport system ATP-binding protein
MALNGVSFSICEGEIFGVAGISGNGQRELVEVLAGLRKPEGGSVLLDGRDITFANSLKRWRLGIGYIPSDRITVGSIADFSLIENITMNYYFDHNYYRRGVLDTKKIRELTKDIIAEYDVITPNADIAAKSLSGGNLQKLILARVLSRKPRLLIVDLPTQGLDVGATEFVRNKLIDATKEGAGVLLISEDLDEVLSLSDWVAPIYDGEFMGILPGEGAKRELVGAMMAGIHLDEESA